MNADDQAAVAYGPQHAQEAAEAAERLRRRLRVGPIPTAPHRAAERFAVGHAIRRDHEFLTRLNRARKDGASHGI